jgi:hypothetical protein
MTLLKPRKRVTVIPGKLFLRVLNNVPDDSHPDHYFLIDQIHSVTFKSILRETGHSALPPNYCLYQFIKRKTSKNKQDDSYLL